MQIKNIFVYLFIALILILATTNVYFITSYKKVIAERDKVLADNITLQASIAKPKVIYKKVVEPGKVTIIERELIKITTQYITVSSTGGMTGTPYGTKYTEQPKPWWEEYGVTLDPNNIPDGWELKDGMLICKEKITIKEPGKIEINRTEGPITISDIRITTNTVILVEKENKPWNVTAGIDSGGTVTVGAGRDIGPVAIDLQINTDKDIGIMGIWRFKIGR